jgi:hypothetical protein
MGGAVQDGVRRMPEFSYNSSRCAAVAVRAASA